MATQLSSFITRIAYRVEACPDPVIQQAVLDACIEFAERSGGLVRTLDATAVAAGAPEVDLDLSSSEKLVRILKVWCGDQELVPLNEESDGSPLLRVDAVTGLTASSGVPRYFAEGESAGTIRLYPRPDTTYYLTARVAVKPSRSSTAVDDSFMEDNLDAVVDGALSRLYAMKALWGNSGLAKLHSANFDRAISGVKNAKISGRTMSELRVKPVRI